MMRAPSEGEQEYNMLKAMQADRMHAQAAEACTRKCVSTYYMNTLVPWENTCLENCLAKHAQADIIINFNINLFGKTMANSGKKGK
jgi:hypothetical protein